jgi:TATA-box binding protein (TBP) (component of TFIID and TFIIIB)
MIEVVNMVVVAMPRGRPQLSRLLLDGRFQVFKPRAGPIRLVVANRKIWVTRSGKIIIPGVKNLEEADRVAKKVFERMGIQTYELRIANMVASIELENSVDQELLNRGQVLRDIGGHKLRLCGTTIIVFKNKALIVGARDLSHIIKIYERLAGRTRR